LNLEVVEVTAMLERFVAVDLLTTPLEDLYTSTATTHYIAVTRHYTHAKFIREERLCPSSAFALGFERHLSCKASFQFLPITFTASAVLCLRTR
jgi:hypothetical protein